MAWGATAAYPFPEIYYNPSPGSPINAQQWEAINQLYPLTFLGSTTQYTASGYSSSTNTPAEGWQQLADASGQSPTYATDFSWAN
jgi:hypothetical protein